MQPFVRTLVKRGHNVTLITPEGMPNDLDGVRHIRVPKLNIRIKRESLSLELNKTLYNFPLLQKC